MTLSWIIALIVCLISITFNIIFALIIWDQDDRLKTAKNKWIESKQKELDQLWARDEFERT